MAYHQDMAALNVLSPTLEPKATDHIPDMITMIQTLLDRGHAYTAQGHVLFDLSYTAVANRLCSSMKTQ